MIELLFTPFPYTGIPMLPSILMVAAWLLLRSRATDLSADAGLAGVIGKGQPVVLDFFSNT